MDTRNLIFVEPDHRDSLKPFSWSRPVSSFRIGILTIAEKWERNLNAKSSNFIPGYLQDKFKCSIEADNLLIKSHCIPNQTLLQLVNQLKLGEFIRCDQDWIAARLSDQQCEDFLNNPGSFNISGSRVAADQLNLLMNLWEIFQWNDAGLKSDFNLICNGRKSQSLDNSNRLIGNSIFIEEGAVISHSVINTNTGPVYIGKDAEIMEGCMIRGSLAVLEKSQLKMGSKIYGATTIGPESRVGGELNNVIIQGFSNKAHDGFLGNSVIGEWCNLGADSNSSNLKNNYEEVKIWNYPTKRFIKTNSLFCGLMMGDHAKCGINTMFNTATVVGYGANVFGDGFPRQYIPEFSWGGAAGFSTFKLEKFFQTAMAVMSRRGQVFNEIDQNISKEIYALSQSFRTWDKQD